MHPDHRWRWPAAGMATPVFTVAAGDAHAFRTRPVTPPAIPVKKC